MRDTLLFFPDEWLYELFRREKEFQQQPYKYSSRKRQFFYARLRLRYLLQYMNAVRLNRVPDPFELVRKDADMILDTNFDIVRLYAFISVFTGIRSPREHARLTEVSPSLVVIRGLKYARDVVNRGTYSIHATPHLLRWANDVQVYMGQ